MGRDAPHLAGHAAAAALGRSADGRGAFAGVQLLRQRWRRDHASRFRSRAAAVRASRATVRLCRRHRCGRAGIGRSMFTAIASGDGCCTIPDADPDCWRRYLERQFGAGAPATENGAGQCQPYSADRHHRARRFGRQQHILARGVSESVDGRCRASAALTRDTPAPRVFGNVSPLDPQLFSRINDFADELLQRRARAASIRRSRWRSGSKTMPPPRPSIWRGLSRRRPARIAPEYPADGDRCRDSGRHWADSSAPNFAAACSTEFMKRPGTERRSKTSLKQYREARAAWAELANRAKGVYVTDITVGEHPQLRGHWLDRLPAIDADIAAIEKETRERKPRAVREGRGGRYPGGAWPATSRADRVSPHASPEIQPWTTARNRNQLREQGSGGSAVLPSCDSRRAA